MAFKTSNEKSREDRNLFLNEKDKVPLQAIITLRSNFIICMIFFIQGGVKDKI